MRSHTFALLLTAAAIGLAAHAETPIRPPGSPTEEPRYLGVDFGSWLVVQALGTTTEPIRQAGTGVPVCVGWNTILTFRADQATCWCWSLDPNVTVAAPTGDGGCQVTDPAGRDGDGACFSTAANETRWNAPAWPTVAARAGSRGYVGSPGGLCTVLTSTTVSFGSQLRLPCRVTADCTALVGGGTCEAFASPLPGLDGRTTSNLSHAEQYARSCAYVVGRSVSPATAFVEGKR